MFSLSSQATSFQKEKFNLLMADLQKQNAFYAVKQPEVLTDHAIIMALNDALIEHQKNIATFSTPYMKEAIGFMINQKIKEHCIRKYKQCVVGKAIYEQDPILRSLVAAKDNHHLLTVRMRTNALTAYLQVRLKQSMLRKVL